MLVTEEALKNLWDRIGALEAALQASQATCCSLLAERGDLRAELADVRHAAAQEILAREAAQEEAKLWHRRQAETFAQLLATRKERDQAGQERDKEREAHLCTMKRHLALLDKSIAAEQQALERLKEIGCLIDMQRRSGDFTPTKKEPEGRR